MSPWTRKTGSCRLLILPIVMLMTKGTATAHYSATALAFTNEQHELRGKTFSESYLKACQIFFPFCSVNPNLRDLKPTFPFKTESLFVFFFGWRGGEKNEIPQRYFLPFCTRKLPSLRGSQFVSNFSHLPPLRQVSWEKASPVQTMVLMGTLLGVVGPGLPLRAVCKWSWTWEIGGQCQVSLVLFQVLWNQIESPTKAAPRGACGEGGGLCT